MKVYRCWTSVQSLPVGPGLVLVDFSRLTWQYLKKKWKQKQWGNDMIGWSRFVPKMTHFVSLLHGDVPVILSSQRMTCNCTVLLHELLLRSSSCKQTFICEIIQLSHTAVLRKACTFFIQNTKRPVWRLRECYVLSGLFQMSTRNLITDAVHLCPCECATINIFFRALQRHHTHGLSKQHT